MCSGPRQTVAVQYNHRWTQMSPARQSRNQNGTAFGRFCYALALLATPSRFGCGFAGYFWGADRTTPVR
jgi:hypothetical protein